MRWRGGKWDQIRDTNICLPTPWCLGKDKVDIWISCEFWKKDRSGRFCLPIFTLGTWENANNPLIGITSTKQSYCLSFSIFSLTGRIPHRRRKLVLYQWLIWPIRNNASQGLDRAPWCVSWGSESYGRPSNASSCSCHWLFWATGKWCAWVYPQFSSEQPESYTKSILICYSPAFQTTQRFPGFLAKFLAWPIRSYMVLLLARCLPYSSNFLSYSYLSTGFSLFFQKTQNRVSLGPLHKLLLLPGIFFSILSLII